MPQRLLLLDFLRLVAAGAVWLFHACYLEPIHNGALWAVNPVITSIAQYGYLGVPVFFGISGFVIASSAENRGRFSFAWARFMRLYPAFLLALIPTITALVIAGKDISLAQFAANLTMAPRIFGQESLDGVFWSLMFEILFYGYVGTLLIGPTFVSRLRLFCTIWLALAAVNIWTALPMKVLLVLEWAPYFCVGCFTWLMSKEEKGYDRALWLASSVVAAFLTMKQTRSDPVVAGLIVVTFSVAFPAIVNARLPQWTARFAIAAGAMSYPLYLVHNVFGSWANRQAGFAFSVAAVLLLSYSISRAEPVIRRLLNSSLSVLPSSFRATS